MNFQTMDYFVALAQKGSFTAAARELYMTQQALSTHIAALERELGCQLVVRRTPLELTYAGRVFYERARKYQRDLRSLRREFDDIAQNQRGELRVGIAFTRSYLLLPRAILDFQERWPNVAVHVTEGAEEPEAVLSGRVDLIITSAEHLPAQLETVPLYRERVVLAVAPALLKKLALERSELAAMLEKGEAGALAGCPFLFSTSEGISYRAGMEFLNRSGVEPKIRVRSDNAASLLALCRAGAGACFTLESMAAAIGDDGLCRFSLPGEYLPPDSGFVRGAWRREGYQWSMIHAFAQSLQRAAEEKSS